MTRRSSVRAQARRIYRDSKQATTPTPDPSPRFAGARGGGENDLTARARALYEDSAVPVREIASVAGVTERTIYKYAAKHDWKPRYRWSPERGWRARATFAPAKGAGARFIRREDKSRPFATGLKALDPAGRARSAAECEEAERVARAARAEAEATLRFEQRIQAIDATNRASRALNDFLAARQAQGARPRTRADALLAQMLFRAVNVRLGRWEFLQAAQADRCGEARGVG